MKIQMFILFFIISITIKGQQCNLMPLPKEILRSEGQYRVESDGVKIELTGVYHNRLQHSVQLFLKRLGQRTTIPMTPNNGKVISIKTYRKGIVKLGEDESYQLNVSSEAISIEAITDIGAIHALETLLQLTETDERGSFFSAVSIHDSPRFPWRGLMLDVSRHFLPVDIIKRNIDAMAVVKLNVLHLHLSDDHGFRLECKTFPNLHKMGSNGEYFTQDQIKEIINYADSRGIRVVPEFDIPGHATSWMVGHPELASASGPYNVETHFGVFYPTMDPTKQSTYKFLEKFLKEMSQLFLDEFFHIGGDEINGKQWDSNPVIQIFMKKKNIKDNHELQAYFNRHLLKILEKNGKKMMGWDEIFQPNLPNNIVIHSWRGRQCMEEAARRGYYSILSNGYYIDLSLNAIKHYLVDPLPDSTSLSVEEKNRILGGEATMWAELVTPENVESRIWPRTAAVAERLWSTNPPSDSNEMYRRLLIISQRLEESGSQHLANREPMMRRLAGTDKIGSLMILANAAEPIEDYRRHGSQEYTTCHPLSRFVDIALPDALDATQFKLLLNKYIDDQNNDDYNELTKMLLVWEMNHSHLERIFIENPNLKEIEPLSINLSMLASTTSMLLKLFHNKIEVSPFDFNNLSSLIIGLSKPTAEMDLPLVDDAKLILSLMVKNEMIKYSTKE